jgi:uncharacterized membrane protein
MFDNYTLISVITLITIDLIYLNVVKRYFSDQIENIQKSPLEINYFGMCFSYVLIILGINYFIVEPRKSVFDAFLLGIIIYGVYETTNYALFKKWSFMTVILDTLWGGLLFAITTYIIKLSR